MAEIMALLCAGGLILLDQISKFLIKSNFLLNQSEPVIGCVLNFTYIHNEGAVGGILAGHPWVFNTITIVVVLAGLALLIARRLKYKLLIWADALIVAGGIGNLIDRLTLGYVVDFIDVQFIDFFVFNLADCCVVIGTGLMLLHFVLDTIRDARRRKAAGGDADGSD